ncbi:unnamed protein product [Chilo suppressalis]|uniref:Uncharacterized protein n=1 Tax=Chilo suppressalis TaxID=168631 RepID=A0ABN8AZP4_CHISP|nr:hypothetical protein evm_004382 [Chilo suppressalis]CAH0401979.1 unnamed protein product [Chilo suppressalis]
MVLLNTKKSIFFIIIFNTCCLTIYINGEDSSDSDDDRLKQALVLVDILKLEYVKTLRENEIFRKKVPASSEEQSTCASTTEGILNVSQYNVTSNNITIVSTATSPLPPKPTLSQEQTTIVISQSQPTPLGPKLPLSPVYAKSWPSATILQPQNPQAVGNVQWVSDRPQLQPLGERQLLNGGYRRMLPRDYYYYFDNPMSIDGNANIRQMPFFYRRMPNGDSRLQYGDPSLSSPNLINSVKNYVTTATPVRLTTTSAVHETKYVNEKIQSTKKEQPKVITNKNGRRRNPILDQVARELINEVGAAGEDIERVTPIKIKHNTVKKLLRSNVMKNNVNHKRTFTKTTIRVHMDRSTRLQLPLSENNAFCFLSPKSALCRSSI